MYLEPTFGIVSSLSLRMWLWFSDLLRVLILELLLSIGGNRKPILTSFLRRPVLQLVYLVSNLGLINPFPLRL